MKINTFKKQLEKIQTERSKAYADVTNRAIQLLQAGSPLAYKEIYEGFEIYKMVEKKEDRFVLNNAPEGYSTLLHTMFIDKNIKDIYWSLTDDLKIAWNANPDLKVWGDRFV